MNLAKTIENIRKNCSNYMDPDLMAFIINDNYIMGSNNILEINDYGISESDSYTERLLKIHEKKDIFLPCGMMTFMPFINECDIFSDKDYNIKLSENDFEKYSDSEEKLFGILVKKADYKYLIGKSDVCSCSVDAKFEEILESESEFYEMILKIITEKIID